MHCGAEVTQSSTNKQHHLSLRTFLKVYMELGSSFLFLQEQIKDIIIIGKLGCFEGVLAGGRVWVVLERTNERHHLHHHHPAASLSSPSAFENAAAQEVSELSLKRNLNNIEVMCVSKLHCSTSMCVFQSYTAVPVFVLTYASLSVPFSEPESLRLAGLLVGFKKLGRAEAFGLRNQVFHAGLRGHPGGPEALSA